MFLALQELCRSSCNAFVVLVEVKGPALKFQGVILRSFLPQDDSPLVSPLIPFHGIRGEA